MSAVVASPGLAWLDALGPQRIRPGLWRTRALLSFLGNPEFSFSSILIGGTNGKGSTAASISAILTAAGVPCGLYTSPHLVSVAERVRLFDRDVSLPALDSALSLIAAVSSLVWAVWPARRVPSNRRIARFIEERHASLDERLVSALLPSGDGLLVAVKR